VLRYTPFFATVRHVLDAGWLGDLVTIQHAEYVGYWHFAHSFVRGNWRNQALASPMILAKACHDLDLLRWFAGDRCTAVASFGGLRHFRADQAPARATLRCTDGCPVAPECPFDAVRFYVERLASVTEWPVSVVTSDPSREGRLTALRTGPYGRCVYRCDNDVADHQVLALEFANGVRATLTVSGLTADATRTIRISGTRGELRGRLDTGEIEVRRFLPQPAGVAASATGAAAGAWDRDASGRAVLPGDQREVFQAAPAPRLSADPDEPPGEGTNGHGGGDDGLISDFVARVRSGRRGSGRGARSVESRTSLAVSLESHLIAFAAERSRLERRLVELGGG
jgi:predicted dehydrogenase